MFPKKKKPIRSNQMGVFRTACYCHHTRQLHVDTSLRRSRLVSNREEHGADDIAVVEFLAGAFIEKP